MTFRMQAIFAIFSKMIMYLTPKLSGKYAFSVTTPNFPKLERSGNPDHSGWG